ncbi:MAG: GNAT family N-acetyltransferase [Pseudoflavonifractor sp.]|nr:GNAT family N-acetyltransferase [Pseudoflavonifractor sp.]
MAFILTDNCKLIRIDAELLTQCQPFSCGAEDLDEFLLKDALLYEKGLLGKTYCWLHNKDNSKIVGFVTLANASIQTTHMHNNPKRHLNKNIPYDKQGRTYPAVLVGRVAVALDFQGPEFRIGTQIMDFVKDWFVAEDNKTGCRYVLVDAVNNPHTLAYYNRNGFKPLFPKEEDEKDFYQIKDDESLRTRMLYFDLLDVL